MDESDYPSPPRAESADAEQTRTTLRALISAGVFGVIGGAIGNWLGKRGNDARGKMAQPIMKWGMGIFWATLAAYSSLKASQTQANARVKNEMRRPPMVDGEAVAPPDEPMHTQPSPAFDSEKKSPAPPAIITKDSVIREGLLDDSGPTQALKK